MGERLVVPPHERDPIGPGAGGAAQRLGEMRVAVPEHGHLTGQPVEQRQQWHDEVDALLVGEQVAATASGPGSSARPSSARNAARSTSLPARSPTS